MNHSLACMVDSEEQHTECYGLTLDPGTVAQLVCLSLLLYRMGIIVNTDCHLVSI